jgi:hypothetical protein
MLQTENCLVRQLARVNKKTVSQISLMFRGMFTKDGLLPLNKAIKKAKGLSFIGIRFVKVCGKWHANEDTGLRIEDVKASAKDLVGEMGGGYEEKNSSTESSSSSEKQYTAEQQAALKNILGSSTNTISTLGTGLNDLLTKSLSGDLTTANQSALRTAKEQNAYDTKNASTQASEALAGKGMLNSGVANSVMSGLLNNEAKANQNSLNTIQSNQEDKLYKALALALGLTNTAGSLATDATGVKSTGQESTDASGWNISGKGKI